MLLTSCSQEPDHVDKDCGTVPTEISELSHSVGSYTSFSFSNDSSTNFEEAAIRLMITSISGEPDCFSFTPEPQIMESITITSSLNLLSGGISYSSGESLNELFKIYNEKESFSVADFINAQTAEPLRFHQEADQIVLQLLNEPDTTIDQPIEIVLKFDDSKVINVEILNFQVFN